MSRGSKIYLNKKLHRRAIELRLAALILTVGMTIMALTLVFSDKEREGFSVVLVLAMAGFIVGSWFLFQTFQFRDFKVYENGIQLPVHKSRDYSLRRFIRFRDISVIEVSSGIRGMVVHYRDRRGRERSVKLRSEDVERDYNDLVQILRVRTLVTVI